MSGERTGPGQEILRFDRRRAGITLGLTVVLAAAAIAVIGHAADYTKMVDAAREADARWLALCVAGEAMAYVGYVLAYHELARAYGGPRLSYWTVSRVVALGFGATVVGSTVGGLATDFWALNRAGEPFHDAARRVLALNTLEWGVLACMTTAAGALVLAGWGPDAPLAMTLTWIILVPACVLAAAWVSAPRRADRLSALPPRVPSPRGRGGRAWAGFLVRELRVGLADAIGGVVFLRAILVRPRPHLLGLLGYPIYWAGDLLVLYAAIRAFGAHIGPAPLVLAFATGLVVTALPLPAGGAGGIEASLALTLSAVGVPLGAALLAAVVYRIVTFWLPLIPALALLPGLPRLNEDLPRAEREEAVAAAS